MNCGHVLSLYRPRQKHERADAVTVVGAPITVEVDWNRPAEPTR